jgi:hypothetical protein
VIHGGEDVERPPPFSPKEMAELEGRKENASRI